MESTPSSSGSDASSSSSSPQHRHRTSASPRSANLRGVEQHASSSRRSRSDPAGHATNGRGTRLANLAPSSRQWNMPSLDWIKALFITLLMLQAVTLIHRDAWAPAESSWGAADSNIHGMDIYNTPSSFVRA